MENSIPATTKNSWLDRPVISFLPKVKLEHVLVAVIILLAVISRFYMVGTRVMSHDEVNHVVPSYDLYLGKGYSHDPVTHGPMQFHLLALSYFMFGDSDFSSRIPSVVFSIANIIFVLLAFKRYLGRTGALLSGVFFLISPYMLFYGRYTRNESFIGLFSVILLYAVLRYLEKGKHSTLYLYSAVLALYFCTKETSFIFTAEMLIFLAFVFLKDVSQKIWKNSSNRELFILFTLISLLFLAVALGAGVINAKTPGETAPVVVANGAAAVAAAPPILKIVTLAGIGLAGVSLIIAMLLLLAGLGWKIIKNIRSFDLLLLTFTLVMPQLIAFPITLLGWNPLDYSQQGMMRTLIVGGVVLLLAIAIGILWKPSLWLKNMGIFYAIFTVLYTTLFTNGQGFFTGMVGSLGYWLSQQSVNRGTQPWYYYLFLQIPMYEYLAALGTITALVIGIKHKLFTSIPQMAPAEQVAMEEALQAKLAEQSQSEDVAFVDSAQPEQITTAPEFTEEVESDPKRLPVLTLLLYWSVMSLLAFSVAGEKMPWLTVHITLPMLLAAGFGIGYLVDSLVSTQRWNIKTTLSLLLFPIFLIGFGKSVAMLFSPDKPFSGMELFQLQLTSTFIFSVIAAILSGWGIYKLTEGMRIRNILKTLIVTAFAFLAVLTARSAFQASYINYDTGKEFLVYAHGARGPKDVLAQVEDISLRTTGGKDIKVAYIGDALYPYWWYFRDYPNKTWIKDKLTHDLEQYPCVITDDTNLDKTRAILGDSYSEFKYKRLVWPMQDYMNQTFKSVWETIKDPKMLQALFDIWYNKDYTRYADIKGISTLTVENWEPSGNIYLFIQKNLVSSIWTYGTVPSSTETTVKDPYAEKMTQLTPDQFFGTTGSEAGQFNSAHGIAVGKNGDIYIADAKNHRIQRFSATGKFISTWGSFASVDNGSAPGGSFNEPWGVAVGPDGSVYVTDTWNYRVQKFTADGKFITMWGTPGTADSPTTFWGPRGIVVNHKGQVFITDTGNNRVVIFDADGNNLGQFGINGIDPGQFDEPVGLAVDSQDNLYVVDTWNQRIQVFSAAEGTVDFQAVRNWSVNGWKGQSVNNKPFIAVDSRGNVYVTDPDGYRVLEFDTYGNLIRGWGQYSSGIDGFGMPISIAIDAEDHVWVSDSDNGYLMRFSMPQEPASMLPQGLPALPTSSAQLTYNLNTGFIEGPFQQPVYRLDTDGSQWIPIIPDTIMANLPTSTLPVKSETGEWVLQNADGSTAYVWHPDLLLWIAIEQAVPSAT
jgi:uncharacterized protein (TIGR03663 family)